MGEFQKTHQFRIGIERLAVVKFKDTDNIPFGNQRNANICDKTFRPELGQGILKGPLAPSGDRSQQLKAGPGRQPGHLLDDLLG
mgnify:CR=1 FL=1